jgi:hypothetical protein
MIVRRTSTILWRYAGGLLFVSLVVASCRSRPSQSANCPVTDPNGLAPAGEAASPLFVTQDGLTTTLWPDGTVPVAPDGPGEIREDGSLAMKFPFWRGPGVRGRLEITGRRLDGDSTPAFGEIPDGYGETGFQSTAIVFPEAGCWEITAKAGKAEMTFVQRVVLTAE